MGMRYSHKHLNVGALVHDLNSIYQYIYIERERERYIYRERGSKHQLCKAGDGYTANCAGVLNNDLQYSENAPQKFNICAET